LRFLRAILWIGWMAALLSGERVTAQAAPSFSVRTAGAAEGWRPVVRVQGVLGDPALRDALQSGLPLRFRLRLELWRKGLFDRLAGEQEIDLALVLDPLDHAYQLETGQLSRRFASLAEAQEAIEAALRPAVRPSGRGRFYYLATLDIETLSLSDLDELRRWLRGEVGPAIQGEAPAGRAVERGLRRVLVRVIGLPTRRYEARTGTFLLQ
jgi:hypothetical protein